MRAGVIALISAVLASVSLLGAPTAAQPKPKQGAGLRVYVVVLDGLEPGEVGPLTPTLSSLRSQGTWYEQARAVLPAETLPNHVAMMTGVLPARNGIIGNDWWSSDSPFFPHGFDWTEMEDPRLLDADTLTTRLENGCQVSTATVMSKTYLFGIFGGEAPRPDDPNPQRQADFHWRAPWYIPISNHHPDPGAMDAFRAWLTTAPPTPQFAFVNLGDIDRSGHADESGASGLVSAFRRAAIQDTDAQLGLLVKDLKDSGAWNETVLVVASDHGMDWSPQGARDVKVTTALNGAGYVRSQTPGPGRYWAVPSGGTAAIYAQDADVAGMAKALSAAPGVAFVATPQSIPELGNPTLREMGLDHRNNGRIVVFAQAGWAVRDPVRFNPLPGNHGHPETQPSVLLVTGGHPALDAQPKSVPGETVYDPATRRFAPPAGGPGNLSIAPTVAALFGIGEPDGGYDRGPLTEAFDRRALKKPQTAC